MNKLKEEDKNKISQILHNNWDLIFKLLVDSSNDECGIPYREVYKWELFDREKDLPEIIDMHLKNNSFFDRSLLKNWIVEDIISALFVYSDCRRIQFFQWLKTV